MGEMEYRLFQSKDFLLANPTGDFDLEQSKQALLELVTMAKSASESEIVLDLRQAYGPSLSLEDLHGLVTMLAEHRSSFNHAIVILVRSDEQFGRARFAELCARNSGFLMKVFLDFESAVNWLQNMVKI